ncbi:CRISPR-associated protein, Crm2 family [Flexistipes sinusarabici DSM 4947]|uniref:CRISPR-associated protein, Crm2 family n=1 Tax=Flexistipes sinusarabici (strain ATCC 49648 / DSM 4947 / MAS 10) TaxID=717231 RepID=F8E948_FLESM|nr:type III-B CRISPR-associated protein Cas10/Cmr2 [Flexistipes sinusarabici]AEI15250.1 CRISPR-associated protein, Crm2 family [Flexistipes sinusarabici DSM 4947]
MAINLPANYWDNKFWAYMHDPFDKCFDIKGHVERAKEIVSIFGIDSPNQDFWKKADGIASGFERGQIVGYSSDEEKSGAVDFLKNPVITHPTGEKSHLKFDLSDASAKQIWEKLKNYLEKEIGKEAGTGGYSDQFEGKPNDFKKARFLYTHLVLRFRLAQDNVGDIGALWHRLPADTRFPDHSIWQHNALVSAIQSCFELGGKDDLGMMVFNISPVQAFISKARKLRDYWTGSVFLSYLAFEGIRWVVENLGPDHILYPSLIDQFLVNEYLRKEWKVKYGVNFLNKESDIASFPNKFLFLLPFSKSEEIAEEVEKSIKQAWKEIYSSVKEGIFQELHMNSDERSYIDSIFNRQNDNFWEFKWASVKMLKEENKDEIKSLLPSKVYNANFDVLKCFNDMIKDKKYYEKSGIGTLYSVSHSLCQSALAAEKNRKTIEREPEPGEKCHICGEFEVVHSNPYEKGMSANEYKTNIDNFWKNLKESWEGEDGSDLKDNEKLCSICLTKRLSYYYIKKYKEHLLFKTFKDSSNFPSTTYMALHDYYIREGIEDENEKIEKAQGIHDSHVSDKEMRYSDKYYALLLMDGDRMGKLVNGETIASTWESIMHPEIFDKLQNGKIESPYSENWQKIFQESPKRNLTPAIHSAISESLGDFAIYGVANIVNNYDGKLIYAGGDDVCAVLPVSNVLKAAEEINDYYKSTFKLIESNQNKINISNISENFKPNPGKLSLSLGKGEEISISAGALICHHKADLTHMIKEAHNLLDKKAKDEGGRNAIAIQLKKRSGGDRFFICKWDDKERLKAFLSIQNKMGEEMSRSLAYRLAELKDGIDAIKNLKGHQESEQNDLLEKFILKQLDRSGKKSEEKEEIAANISKIIFDHQDNFSNEGLIIAGFLHRDEEVANV